MCKILEKDFSLETNEGKIPKNIQEKANDPDMLVDLVKEKLETPITRREIIQLLTLAPTTWSRKKLQKISILVSIQFIQHEKSKKKKCIIALPNPRKGRLLDHGTVHWLKITIKTMSILANYEYAR